MSSSSWVLVTGANRGLGYATAQKLVSDGESVIVGARSQATGALSRMPHALSAAVTSSTCRCILALYTFIIARLC